MRRFSTSSLAVVFISSVLGCTGSHKREDETDSVIGGVGDSGNKQITAGSGGIDRDDRGVETSVVWPLDAAAVDVAVERVDPSDGADAAGAGGSADAAGAGGSADAASVADSAVNAGNADSGGADSSGGGSGDAEIYRHGDVTVERCTTDCPDLEWIAIPGGTFQMGSPDAIGEKDEHPQHEVTVPSFRIMKTEVTVSQYGKCVTAGVCSEPDGYDFHSWRNWGAPGREDYPVNGITWNQAREFSQWVGARLPSEAEWEYAARSGGQDIVFPWGNEEPTYRTGFDCEGEISMKVCSVPAGNTAQGLCDMAGNILEWVEDDAHDRYYGAPTDGSAWIDEPRFDEARVLRGGYYGCPSELTRCADRGMQPIELGEFNSGFRLALDTSSPSNL